jgi:hypothetical protein
MLMSSQANASAVRGLNMPSMPAGSYQPASASYLDAGGERAAFHVFGTILTTGNIVAQTAAWADVLAALDALALGARIEDTYNDVSKYSVSRPTNGAAREVALQVWFQDATTGAKWSASLPTVDISLIEYVDNIGAKDAVDPSTTEVAALTAALEAFPVRNPLAQSNTVGVIGYKVVRGMK